ASGTASPAGTPASFLKALAASKMFLIVAALTTVVCIPLGYRLRLSREILTVVAPEVETGLAAPQAKAAAATERSAIFAEWKCLHDTHGTNTEAMPGIYREIAGLSNSVWR